MLIGMLVKNCKISHMNTLFKKNIVDLLYVVKTFKITLQFLDFNRVVTQMGNLKLLEISEQLRVTQDIFFFKIMLTKYSFVLFIKLRIV